MTDSSDEQPDEPRPDSEGELRPGVDPIAPAIVLVRPQLAENIGAAARAMWNCGLSDLRLVTPRDGWPSERARASATAAAWVADEAKLFATTREATADLHHLFATTARPRDMTKGVVTPQQAVELLMQAAARGERGGFLFGPERTGLDNEDVVLAAHVLQVPLNPHFRSLNLAQAVLLVAWEWLEHRTAEGPKPKGAGRADAPAATTEELVNFFDHLEQELDNTGFLRVVEKRPITLRNLRNLFHRARLRDYEVKILHGVVSSLAGRRKDGRFPKRHDPNRGVSAGSECGEGSSEPDAG